MAKPPKPRGEIAELTASLQSLCTAGKNAAKRDVFRRVINYLTVGMDMSSLFPSMTSCANLSPDDLVLKKMLYLYLAHYATQTPDLALLTINQLLKDCVDTDPFVRGLALRSLCSLRLPNFLEYVTSPVLQGLSDRHPYVRRTAVMGVLKIYHVDKAVEHTGMLETVRQMLLSDSDPQVIGNCLTVLLQALGSEVVLDKPTLYHLINRLKELSEWSQVQVLELAGQYQPVGGEAEVYDLLNALEDRLAAPNSAVALAATKAFLHLTLAMPATHQQVLERIQAPLKSVIGRDEPAITYAVLANVLLLAQRAPVIFEADYATFYCRAHDPWYIKKLKMEILSALASSSNVYDVVNELTEYARDVVHPNMAREAVRAVGRIALAVPDVGGIVERLLIFLESGCEAVVSEALVVMKDLLRRFPEMAEVVVAQVMSAVTQGQGGSHALSALSGLSEAQARAALLWIMGQWGQYIPEAPYLLEALVSTWGGEEPEVKTALLTAAAQLFFKRPPESRALLGAVLAAGLADSNQDVHDRALCYYRLLRVNIGEAERIINPPLQAVMCFSEALTPEMKDTIFNEFNTLSVIYQVPAATFLEQPGAYALEPLESTLTHHPADPAGGVGTELEPVDNSTNLLAADDLDAGSSLLGGGGGLEVGGGYSLPGGATGTGPGGGAGRAARGSEMDLLDMDLLGGGGGPASDAGGAGATSRPGIQLDAVPLTAAPAAAAGAATGLAALDMLGMQPHPHLPSNGLLPATQPATQSVMALDLDDMFSLATSSRAATGAPQPSPPHATAVLELDPQGRLQPRAFQEKWKALPTFRELSKALSHATITAMAANNHKDFCTHLTQAYLQTMASGGQPPVYKYYFYGLTKANQAGLVELLVHVHELKATMTFKSELGSLSNQFLELFENCLAGYER